MAGRNLTITMRETNLDLIEGDLTEMEVDVVVNPANEELQMRGPVSREIVAKGGGSIQEECDRIGGTSVGTAVMTGAGDLKAKQVIHAVGPRPGEGEEDRKLSSAIRSALALTERHGLRSIALPAMAEEDFGLPSDRVARLALTEVQRYIQGGTKLERVVVVVPDDPTFEMFKRELRRGFR